jgi:Na+-translocating ferredoxin:NAD+ oxidoreductase RnfG subunit
MKRLIVVAALLTIAVPVRAHITPPRILLQDMEAVRLLLPGAQTYSRADLKPTFQQKKEVKQAASWTPDQKTYKTFVGRDAQGREIGRVVFIGEITIHGMVQMAVGLDDAGNVKGARVVAITDEAFGWVKPLIERDFTAQFVGKKPTDQYFDGQRVAARRGSMEKFYSQVLASLIQRSAVLCHVAGRPA